MKLYYCETTNPRKACALAKHLALPVEYQHVDLFAGQQNSSEFFEINPNRKVPVLVDDDVRVFESTAIMLHLSNAASAETWPSEPAGQVEVMQWLSWDSAHLSRHAGTVYFEQVIKAKASMGEPNPTAIEEAVGFFRQFAGVLDQHMEGRSFVVGEQLTIADFGVACVMTVAREFGLSALPISEFSAITRWLDRLDELPAWRDPWPAASKTA